MAIYPVSQHKQLIIIQHVYWGLIVSKVFILTFLPLAYRLFIQQSFTIFKALL